jgi:very-short-patch-repair endonuclease
MDNDRRIAELARRQKGLVTRAQLYEIGLSPRAVSRRASDGRLHRVHRGVFSLSPVLAPLARELAAILAIGGDAVVSHRTAASLWNLLPPGEGDVHVTVTDTTPRQRPGIKVHRAKEKPARLKRDGIPLTTPEQTLYDLAATDQAATLERALNEALATRTTNRKRIRSIVEKSTNRTAKSRLTEALNDNRGFTQEEAERRLRHLIKTARLPPAEHNAQINGFRVDALWRTQRLVVEIDGYATHTTPRAFDRDRRKDAQLTNDGYRVLRFTWRQLTTEPEATAATIARAL